MYDQDEQQVPVEPILEPEIIPEENYTLETTSERSSFLRRLIVILVATSLFVLFSQLDPNHAFNPVTSQVFTMLGFVVFVLAVVFLVSYIKTTPDQLAKRSFYLMTKRQNNLMEFLVVLPVLMLVFTLLNMFVFSFSPISGTSMEPNFHDSEAVVFTHVSKEYERFDVIILYVGTLNDPYLIKRVIGLPGETVVIDDNEVYIDGVLLEQDFIDQDAVKTYCTGSNNVNYCEFDVPADSYFVLGDNRDGNGVTGAPSGYSIDSRTFGPIHRDDTYGKVVWTFSDFNLLD